MTSINGADIDKTIHSTATRLGELLLARRQTVTCAESCTAGGVAYAITSVTGSSGWFESGYVTYSNRAKEKMLGVSSGALANDGAVSEAVVRQMAAGALKAAGADHAVAISGIAGPDGGTVDKPVGTVWFAWADNSGETVRCAHFQGDRAAVRQQAILVALEGMVAKLGITV